MNASRLRLTVVLAAAALCAAAVRAQERLITKAIEVRSLSFAEADQGIPVRLRGIVIYIEGPSAVFFQDDTSTTFFRIGKLPALQVGNEIEVRGVTRMGLYLPGLDATEVNVVGHGALPPGIPAHYDDLVFGRYHYQRVAVEGVVRAITPLDSKKSLIRLAMGSRVIEARVEQPPEADRPLVDHRVRVTGLSAGLINERRHLVQPHVRVVNWNDLEVLAPAPPAAEVPLVSAEELLAFRVTGLGEQRVRVEGVVTAVFPRGQIFLRQGGRAFGVRLGAAADVSPGDRVAIVGFPEMERFSASVVDAELVHREPGAAAPALEIDSPDKLTGTHDGDLVTVTSTVRDGFKTEAGSVLSLDGRTRSVQARLPEGVELPASGALVRISGICQVESATPGTGFSTHAGIVSLRVRSAADLRLVRAPPWWTARRLGLALAIFAGILVLAGLWIAGLRLQVRRQTEALRRRIESEAALEERQRIAREFHDTLAQELAGVSLRLDALATREMDQKGRDLTASSRNLVSRIQAETHDLICDLRDATEKAGDLRAALAGVAARQAAENGVDVRVESPRETPALPAAVVHDLRMIARESVTNAIKHGRATCVKITVEPRADRLVMRVIDNGCGFDSTAGAPGKRGHFGCAGIRERARRIGAEIGWESTLQKGTTVEVTIPAPRPLRAPADEANIVEVPSPRSHPSAG